jgi:lipoprotein-releasing system permease protein
MSERRSLGKRTALLGSFLTAHIIGATSFLLSSTRWFPLMLERELLWERLAVGWGLVQIALAVLGVVVARQASRLARGTRGRARSVWLGVSASLYALASSGSLGIVLWAAHEAEGHVIGGTLASLFFALVHLSNPPLDLSWVPPTFNVVTSMQGITASVSVILLIATWFLWPIAKRERFWRYFDVLALAAFVATSLLFPISPVDGDAGSLARAATRVAVTTIFVIRLSTRLVTPLLSAFERIGFQPMVAARHLRARKSGFLAASGTLSILAVAVSSCMLVSVLSVMGGFRNDLKAKILGNHAHVVIDREDGEISDWPTVLRQVRGAPRVVGATAFAEGEVLITSLSNRTGAVLRGIDTSTVAEVTDLAENLTFGKLEYLDHPERIVEPKGGSTGRIGPLDAMVKDLSVSPKTGDEPAPEALPSAPVLPGIIVGQELARTLRLIVGDRVTVVSPRGELGPSGPIPKARPFRVAGIFYSGMYEYDMKHAYVSLDVAQRFLRLGDTISGIEIKVDELESAPRLAADLAASLQAKGLRVRDWQTLNQQLFGALALEKLAMFITLGIAVLIAGFSVFGTLTLLVQEKRREVGILKAMGTSARSVVRIFVLEGLLIGLAGALLGLGLGFVVTFAAEHFGIRMNPEVYYIDKLPVHLDPTEFSTVGVATVLVCLAATLFPAYQASRVRPVDALRYD